ncbi:MAG TPA: hypothetical protein PLR50_11130, partial [Candidatus Rifleibacterium sp.]|nr:hypothetical protein [Candidatus Rifleibacterium sp.]
MINPDGRIEWPYFTRRCDFIIPSASPLQLQVSEVFNHGFDARCEERLFYFATEAPSLHPL